MNQLAFGIKLSTSKSVERMQEWLKKNCPDGWQLDFEGVSNDLKKKSIAIYFSTENDKNRFKQFYSNL
ncbi:MAG: hypothetical protein H7840_04575 [Alphaproteobacteria bacterium]